jgi:hypothetical protein
MLFIYWLILRFIVLNIIIFFKYIISRNLYT